MIFYFSSQSIIYAEVALKEEIGLSIQSWAMHVIEYAILSLLLYRALIKSRFKKYSIILAIIISALYGLSDEIHQLFVPGRAFDVLDLIFDFTGAILMQILIKIGKK